MTSTKLLIAAVVATSLTCGAAQARTILINDWHDIASESVSGTQATLPNPTQFAIGGGAFTSLLGVTSLSFGPGTTIPGAGVQSVFVDPSTPSSGTLVGYHWLGNPANFASPGDEQIVLGASLTDNNQQGFVGGGSTSAFSVRFNYNDGTQEGEDNPPYQPSGAGETAFLAINGTQYTAPVSALTTDNDTWAFSYDSLTKLLDFTAPTGWSTADGGSGGGTTGAPEIDPASGISALTLLAGALAVLVGFAPRRKSHE